MTTPTTTRAELRRKICKELRMPFFRRVSNTYSTVGASSTTGTIIDAKLTQPDGTWNGSWFYDVTTGEVSLIRSFKADSDTFYIEKTLAASPVGNYYEIHSIWNADEIHDAINESIRVGRRTFPELVTDETIVMKEEVMTYPITGLSTLPWMITKIWVEEQLNCDRGNVVSATSTSVTLPSVPSDLDTSWKITTYAGKGAGQIRNVGVVTGNSFAVVAWTTVPDSTTKYALFHADKELVQWAPFNDFHTDTEEFPATLYLNELRPSLYGMRIRIEMLAVSQELTTEAGVTYVPAEFIKAKACSILHGQALSNTKADKDTHYSEYRRYMEEADAYVVRNAVHTPGVRFRTPNDSASQRYQSNNNPLGWDQG